jgi:hypothetical protein
MAMTWYEMFRLLGLDLLALLLAGFAAGDCVEYVVRNVIPRNGHSPH